MSRIFVALLVSWWAMSIRNVIEMLFFMGNFAIKYV